MNTAIHALETNLASTVNFTNLQRANKSITQQMASLHIPGVSVALIDNYQIAWTKTWGVVDSGTNVAVTPSTLFQAASMSKPVAALGALRMVEAGELSLSEPINNYLTRWQVPANELTGQQAVTLSHLLSHTAGTTVHGFLGYTQDLTQPTAIEILNGAKPANSAAVEVDTVPGTQHRYSRRLHRLSNRDGRCSPTDVPSINGRADPQPHRYVTKHLCRATPRVAQCTCCHWPPE